MLSPVTCFTLERVFFATTQNKEREKSFVRFYCCFFLQIIWKSLRWLLPFKTLMANFSTDAFHPGNGALPEEEGEGKPEGAVKFRFQPTLHKETLTDFTNIFTCRKTIC